MDGEECPVKHFDSLTDKNRTIKYVIPPQCGVSTFLISKAAKL
jgi:hypothetical protein